MRRELNLGVYNMSATARLVAASVALLAAAIAAPASAQTISAAPTYGSVTLQSGFTPDPFNVQISSGGPINVANSLRGDECVGFIANAPDFNLNWVAGSGALPLFISANSAADTTLVINTPDGRWYCSDDGGVNALNPGLRITNPQGGLYNIWVGTYGNAANHPATLSISELNSN
jgi:hypothetical protein